MCGLAFGLTNVGRSGEAMAVAEDALNAASAHANPYWIGFAYYGHGKAFIETDPSRALDTYRLGLAYTREHRLPRMEALIAMEAAGLEAVHGGLNRALKLFTASIDSFHQAGDPIDLAGTFARLAILFDRTNSPEIAATVYEITTYDPSTVMIRDFASAIDHLRNTLDNDTFDRCVAIATAMDTTEAVHYSRAQIEAVRSELAESS